MADKTNDTLQQRKLELEAELAAIEDEMDYSVDKVKSDVSSTLDPVEYIKRHPLAVVASSVVIGYLVGKGSHDSDEENELLSTLWYEIKRLAVRKGVGLLSDHADNFLSGSSVDPS